MTTNRLADLIAKKKAGEIAPQELVELNALLKSDEDARAAMNRADLLWNHTLQPATVSDSYVSDRWNALSNKLFTEKEEQPIRRMQPPVWKKYMVAAACVLLIGLAGVIFKYTTGFKTTHKQNIVSTKNGSRSKVDLPDGTKVWLNSGSQLVYNDSFGEELREVKLVGEAFFDVAKDAAHPFVIHANEINIKVLGTAFNVRAYPDDKRTEAALINGLIEVSFRARPSDRMLLKPNEKISVMNGQMQIVTQQDSCTSVTAQSVSRNSEEPLISFSKIKALSPVDSTLPETAWIANKLIFRNRSFEELMREMQRWYNINLECKDSALLQKHFTGSFYHESVTEALDILRLSCPFHYTADKQHNTIVIDNQ